MNPILLGQDYFNTAIAEALQPKITHIAIKDESTNTIVKIAKDEYTDHKFDLLFIEQPDPSLTDDQLFQAALNDRPF